MAWNIFFWRFTWEIQITSLKGAVSLMHLSNSHHSRWISLSEDTLYYRTYLSTWRQTNFVSKVQNIQWISPPCSCSTNPLSNQKKATEIIKQGVQISAGGWSIIISLFLVTVEKAFLAFSWSFGKKYLNNIVRCKPKLCIEPIGSSSAWFRKMIN